MSKQATQPLRPPHERPTREQLLQLMRERILVLDGAYGSAFQNYSLSEEAFRGESYADHGHPLQGNHDILNLTQPQRCLWQCIPKLQSVGGGISRRVLR